MICEADKLLIGQLQRQILRLQGEQLGRDKETALGLGEMESSFPNAIFPRAAVHELISLNPEDASCTTGFISMILGKLMKQQGSCIWIGNKRGIYPPALRNFGIEPDRMLFVETKNKHLLWTLEEALKCDALTAVIGEIPSLSFQESRRLQLAVEKSRVTGFIHRYRPKSENTVTCVSRWKITTQASSLPDGLPGVGFPEWKVQLLKVRNGMPGEWQVQWSPEGLRYIQPAAQTVPLYELQTA